MKSIILLSILFSLVSCFKTAQQIQQERFLNTAEDQFKSQQQTIAKLTLEVRDLQDKLNKMSGNMEEFQQSSPSSAEEMMALQERVKALQNVAKENETKITSIRGQVKKQNTFVKKVTSTLGGMTSTYKMANSEFEKGRYKKAKDLYQEALTEKVNAAQKNLIWFNLGYIDYNQKNYDNALIYFSKIYTKFPKSSYAPRSLLYIARSFHKKGQKPEAKQTYEELIAKYPKSKHVKYAKDELKKI